MIFLGSHVQRCKAILERPKIMEELQGGIQYSWTMWTWKLVEDLEPEPQSLKIELNEKNDEQ